MANHGEVRERFSPGPKVHGTQTQGSIAKAICLVQGIGR
jgi:hypothetical protein